MKKGNILVAEGTSNRGTETKDTYSLLVLLKRLKKLKMSAIKKNIYNLTKKELEEFIKNKEIKLFRSKPDMELVICKRSNKFF